VQICTILRKTVASISNQQSRETVAGTSARLQALVGEH